MAKSTKEHLIKKNINKPFVFSNLETRDAKKMYLDVPVESYRKAYLQLRDGQKIVVLPRYWQNISDIDTDNANLVVFVDPEADQSKPIKIIWGNNASVNPNPVDAPTINIEIV